MEQEKIVDVTVKAQQQIKEIFLREGHDKRIGLRLGVIGGGCSGLSYKMEFGEKKEKDKVYDFSDFQVFLDPKSAIYLRGIVLDYRDGLNGKGFVFENPNAKNTCGCGESFSV